MNTLGLIKDGLNSELSIEGVLLTMADYRTNLTNEVISEIRSYFKERVYNTIIPRNVRLSEAPSYGKPITRYDKNSIGAQKYRELAEEVLKFSSNSHNILKKNELQDNRQPLERTEESGTSSFGQSN